MKESAKQVSSHLDKVLKDKYFMNTRKKSTQEYDSFKIIRRLMSYSDSMDVIVLTLGMIAALLSGLTTPISGLAFGSLSTAFVGQVKSTFTNSSSDANGTNEFMGQVLEQCSYLMYLGVISFVINFIMTYSWDRVTIKQAYKIREVFFAQAMRQELAWYEQKPASVNLTTRMTDDVEKFKIGFGSKVPSVVQAFVTFFGGFIIGFYVNWKLTLVACVMSPLVIGFSIFHMMYVRKSMDREQSRYSEASTIATRTLSSFQIVSSLGNRIGEMLNFNQAVKEGIKANKMAIVSSAVSGSISYGIVYIMYAVIIWYGGILMTTGEIDSNSLFSVIRCVVMGAMGVGNTIASLTMISQAIASSANLLETIENLPVVDPYSRKGIIQNSVEGELELKDIYFAYPTRKSMMVLCGLSLTVPKGKVVALVGSSGSGKSTVVNMILRFYDPISGTVLFDGMDVKKMNLKALRSYIGVVSQEPVLFNVSVEENIRYGRTDATFEDIEKAAKLAYAHDFIQLLPDKYQSLLGERGTKISGGQKQRIAIARALVRDPKILLLDEATSALDSSSEAIVQASLENAMRGRATIIIAHRLSTVKNADVIHVMSKGRIVETGKHEELMNAKGVYYDLVHRQQSLKDDEEKVSNTALLSQQKQKEFTAPSSINKLENQSLESFPVKKFLVLCRKWLTSLGFFTSLLSAFATPIFSFLFGQVVVASALPQGQLLRAFNLLSIYFVILGLLTAASKAISIVALSVGTESVVGKIRIMMFHTILSQEYQFLEEEDTSPLALATKLARDPPKLKGIAGIRFGMTFSLAVAGLATVVVAFVTFWEVALLLTFIIPIVTYAGYKQFMLSVISFAHEHHKSLQSTKLAAECFENIKTIQFLGLQEYAVKQFSKSLELEMQNEYRSAFYFALTYSIVSSCQFFALGASYLLGGKLITLGIGTTSNLYTAVTGVTTSMSTAANILAFMQDTAKCKDSMVKVLNLIYQEKKLDPFDDSGKKPVFKGRIAFHDVWFSYKSKENRPILKGFNLEIEPGQTVALVGQSGCGKSTIVNLIERFYTPTRGKITIDGVDIREINVDHLRKHIGLVTQEPTLFDLSIKDNIVYGSKFSDIKISDDDVVKATSDANIHDFINCLPQAYDTKVGGRGCLLSGGQKQRIAIARALVRNPTLLLLDEATSALDAESEKAVQDALEKAQKGRTSLVIAHRLSTIKNADLIVVLEEGQIVEKGTHDELVELKGRYYCQLTQK